MDKIKQRSDLFKMEKYICYIQDTLHCPLWVWGVFCPVWQIFIESHLPPDCRIFQLWARKHKVATGERRCPAWSLTALPWPLSTHKRVLKHPPNYSYTGESREPLDCVIAPLIRCYHITKTCWVDLKPMCKYTNRQLWEEMTRLVLLDCYNHFSMSMYIYTYIHIS